MVALLSRKSWFSPISSFKSFHYSSKKFSYHQLQRYSSFLRDSNPLVVTYRGSCQIQCYQVWNLQVSDIKPVIIAVTLVISVYLLIVGKPYHLFFHSFNFHSLIYLSLGTTRMALNKIKGTINARTTSNCGSAKCQLPVTNEGIQCDTCDMWFHSRCSKLAKLALKLYTDHKFLKWVCTNCTTTIRKSHVNKHTNPGKATTSKSRYSDVAASLSASDVYVSSQKSTESNKPNCSPLSSVGDAPLSPCRSRAHRTLLEPALLIRKLA